MADETVGVAKVVKLGADTVLMVEINPAQDVAEGEYTIKSIEVVNKDGGGIGGADNCIIQIIQEG